MLIVLLQIQKQAVVATEQEPPTEEFQKLWDLDSIEIKERQCA